MNPWYAFLAFIRTACFVTLGIRLLLILPDPVGAHFYCIGGLIITWYMCYHQTYTEIRQRPLNHLTISQAMVRSVDYMTLLT